MGNPRELNSLGIGIEADVGWGGGCKHLREEATWSEKYYKRQKRKLGNLSQLMFVKQRLIKYITGAKVNQGRAFYPGAHCPEETLTSWPQPFCLGVYKMGALHVLRAPYFTHISKQVEANFLDNLLISTLSQFFLRAVEKEPLITFGKDSGVESEEKPPRITLPNPLQPHQLLQAPHPSPPGG